jgi:hypothetical protein
MLLEQTTPKESLDGWWYASGGGIPGGVAGLGGRFEEGGILIFIFSWR